MPKILTVEQMREVEKAADASGLTYDQMMENAGRAVAQAILARVQAAEGTRVAILVGSGNNGGDGLVAGHYLAEAGAQVSTYLAAKRPESDPNLARLQARGLLLANAEDDQRWRVLRNMLANADVVIDALLGTGFRLPLRDSVKEVLATSKKALAGREEAPLVVALDCPSGLDCDTGQIAQEALCADLTVTLAAAKAGLFRFPGAASTGDVIVADIGIPASQRELSKVKLELATGETVRQWLPERPRDAHKGSFGQAVIVAGSVNFPGASLLAGLAAYRVGAGLVTLAVPSVIQSLLVSQLPEATWILLPHELGVIAEGAASVLKGELGSSEAILLGPGFGQDPATEAFLAKLLGAGETGHRGRIGFIPTEGHGEAAVALPACVVDADGLKLLSKIEDWPKRLPRRSVLTPHPGEMAVLTGLSIDEIQADRVAAAGHWAATWGHVVVLKGAFTVVAAPEGQAMVLPFATPALARAGTGDVLAGAIVGLRAQGVKAFEAAVLGAYLHGRAGELAAQEVGTAASVLAGEVAEALPMALAELMGRR
ncbi:MAG: NAD(P)H-hydrate dehydratase [Anaerolineales bacterium]|nr:NAD(P)H-hydrate dehydratase [Anaerolineales bacterium]